MTDSELGSFGEIGHRAKNTYLCLSLSTWRQRESLWEKKKWVSEWNEENSPPVSEKKDALIELRLLMQTNIKKGPSIRMGRKDLERGWQSSA